MFKKGPLFFILLLGVGLFGTIMFSRINQFAVAIPAVSHEKEGDFENTWNELTSNWLASLLENPNPWVYVVYKEDLAGNLGQDSYTGWPLPNHTIVEQWVRVNGQGYVEISVDRRTDTERGNVWFGSRMNGKQITYYPSGNIEFELSELDTLQRAIDPDCVSFGRPSRNVSLELIDVDEYGINIYVASLVINYPEPEKVSGPVAGVFKGIEVKCTRDARTGAPLSVEQVLISENGERVFLYRMYDYTTTKVLAPPDEILSILK